MAPQPFQLRELFHLVFLRQLAQRLIGRPYVLKGGICLRFFHGSQRLSEDADFDISSRVPVKTLQNTVDRILESKALQSTLVPVGVTRLETSKPKQTETVQRWKIGLLIGDSRISTKIEFSRRHTHLEFDVGSPSREILNFYHQPSFAVQYYGCLFMMVQKILALAASSRNAVRDLFDLHHLLAFQSVDVLTIAKTVEVDALKAAIEKMRMFHHRDFIEQVRPYLTAELISLYSNALAFESMKTETLEFLRRGL